MERDQIAISFGVRQRVFKLVVKMSPVCECRKWIMAGEVDTFKSSVGFLQELVGPPKLSNVVDDHAGLLQTHLIPEDNRSDNGFEFHSAIVNKREFSLNPPLFCTLSQCRRKTRVRRIE